MQIPSLPQTEALLVTTGLSARVFPLTVGDTVMAEVMTAADPGTVLLRMMQEGGRSVAIPAKTVVPLNPGDTVRLRVLGVGEEVKLQLLSTEAGIQPQRATSQTGIQQTVLTWLAKLSASRLTSQDFALLREVFRHVPETLKVLLPELDALVKLMPEIEKLNAEMLQSSAEQSGVPFETRLKLAAQEFLRSGDASLLKRLASEPDQKGFLLKIQTLLQDELLADALKDSGLTPDKVTGAIDRLLKNEVFGHIPETLKVLLPELDALVKLMPEIEELNAEVLQSSVEQSGVLFETRVKLAAQEFLRSGDGSLLKRLASEPDQKGFLLKIQTLLQDEHLADALKDSGLTPDKVTGAIDRLLKNIEFFQLSSKVNEMLYTFLPLGWQELRDGDLAFSKGRGGSAGSYTCNMRLDLEPAGRLAISVTLFEGAFYVSFRAEKADTKARLISERAALEKIFADAGLPLKAINVGDEREGPPCPPTPSGLDLKV